ncbi:hypothetical protein [Peribacillus sp. SCS-155]|uniref:hypothetical protein n=1 Tax=Peribacillus sedimenti TaxID=3115297 RepID=UPI003905D7DA
MLITRGGKQTTEKVVACMNGTRQSVYIVRKPVAEIAAILKLSSKIIENYIPFYRDQGLDGLTMSFSSENRTVDNGTASALNASQYEFSVP